MPKKPASEKTIATLTHPDAKRPNIPTVEQSAVARERDIAPVRVAYERRNADLDPQLIWRGKYGPDGPADEPLEVRAAPLYIQEKVHPKALIDDLKRESARRAGQGAPEQLNLFADFNGLPEGANKTEFYRHDQNWANRMILGDSLQVMAGLAEREGLRGQVQCIYIDPPYGIKFNSNFQWSTTSRDVKDGKMEHITREPEQVKAFRDTWRDGINSYLTYLRDRLIVARELLAESGSVFVQIGDENVHRVRCLMDEVFGENNFVSEIAFAKTTGLTTNFLSSRFDFLLWYAKSKDSLKFRRPYLMKSHEDGTADTYSWIRDESGNYRALGRVEKESMTFPDNYRIYKPDNITSQGNPFVDFTFEGKNYSFRSKTPPQGLARLAKAGRIHKARNSIQYVRYLNDFALVQVSQLWIDTGTGSFTDDKLYVVQTGVKTIQRCILMTTDPGDLVLDPTCGSGTTAYVAEQWGRRWITIDTSRVALALARARLMGARYPYYVLADSPEGREKEAELAGRPVAHPPASSCQGRIRRGFVYERVPHITLKSIANNAEIDVIWDRWQATLEPLREGLNAALGRRWREWEIPREADAAWPLAARERHARWWEARIARQREIDASIAAKAEFECLYDRPFEDKKTVRVAGPFTVESLSPHRMLAVDADGEILDPAAALQAAQGQDFANLILENLRTAGVQQAHKADKITFTSLQPWPGEMICAEGHWQENEKEKRAGILIGPEFGSLGRADLMQAAREASEAGFDALIACAFNYDAMASEVTSLGRIAVLKARMNADLHMAEDLKNNGKGNLFVIFGEPDVEVLDSAGNSLRRYENGHEVIDTPADGQLAVKILGVDVFDPNTGEVRSDSTDTIACWFLDTDYNAESFFVRHAYFLGAGDPYKSLKTSLKAEIDAQAWASLHSDTSRPFPRPASGRIAVKVINHLGDEVMKVFKV